MNVVQCELIVVTLRGQEIKSLHISLCLNSDRVVNTCGSHYNSAFRALLNRLAAPSLDANDSDCVNISCHFMV